MNYKELREIYNDNFSFQGLDVDITHKFALISLICFLTSQARKKNPDATCYEVITKIEGDCNLDVYQKFLKGLSIVCESYMSNNEEYPLFDMKSSKEIIAKIKSILVTWVPF